MKSTKCKAFLPIDYSVTYTCIGLGVLLKLRFILRNSVGFYWTLVRGKGIVVKQGILMTRFTIYELTVTYYDHTLYFFLLHPWTVIGEFSYQKISNTINHSTFSLLTYWIKVLLY